MENQLPFTLLDHQPVSIVYYEPVFSNGTMEKPDDFRIRYCNNLASKLSNLSVAELTGQTILSLGQNDPQVRSVLFQQLNHVYASGNTIQDEYYSTALDKHLHVIRNKVDNGVLTMARDITDEVKLKKEKDAQTALANLILNNSLNGWFYCDAMYNAEGDIEDFKFVRINPGFTRIIGLSEEEVIGKTHLTLFPTARTNGIHALNCKVVKEQVVERKQLHYEGDELDAWYDIVVSPLGKHGLLVTFADITHTKQKELEVARYAETLATVINTVQVGIFTFKPEYNKKGEIIDFRFTMVNPMLSSYVAQEPEMLVGSLGSEWFPGYLQNGVFDMYRETYLTGQLQRKQFHYNVDGIDVYLDLQSTRIGDEVLVTFSDFTPLQLAQLELQKSIRELQRSNQNLEEFTRAASHDLKEPIRKIQIFSDRLKHSLRNSMDNTAQDIFNRMESAATRMRTLIDDLLEYSHVTSELLPAEPVDVNEVLQQVISDLEIMIEESGAVIECENLPMLVGHRRQLQQLFLNLINNSIKYRKTEINPHIYIHSQVLKGSETALDIPAADLECDFFKIEVSDNGIGFDQNDAEKIFNVFTRLHNSKQYAGTGIGLSIATKVMENHKGYIFASGVKGQGATFTLLFPK